MKYTTRRFITAALLCVATIGTLVIPSSSQGQGVISISSTMALGPRTTTPGFVSDVTYGLLNGLSSYGLWQPIANGSSINVSNIFYSGSVGSAMYCTLAVTSSVPFTLAGIFSGQTSPFFAFSGTIGDDGFTYTKFGIGIDANGNTYTSGNANTPVNAVYIVGYNYAINIAGSTMQQASADWMQIAPNGFSYAVDYTVNGTTISRNVNFTTTPVPEPSALAISILGGVLGLGHIIRRKKK